MAETTEWPYDADQDDPLTAMRIPVVGHAWPGWAYIVAFDSGRLDDESFRPTDLEAAQHWVEWKAAHPEVFGGGR